MSWEKRITNPTCHVTNCVTIISLSTLLNTAKTSFQTGTFYEKEKQMLLFYLEIYSLLRWIFVLHYSQIPSVTLLIYLMFMRLRPCISKQESIDLPGHFSSLQVTCSVAFDISQGIPSGSGTGLLHIRDRYLVPPLQEAEHSEN